MKLPRRLSSVVVTSALLAVALGGCSFVGDAGQVWGIVASDAEKQRKVASVVSALEGIEGVESASSDFSADGPAGDEVHLQVTVGAASTKEQAWKIATITYEAFSSVELAETVPLLTLRIAGNAHSVLTRSFFAYSDEQFAEDFDYWRAIEKTVGTALSMSLTEGYVTGTYLRTFMAPDGVDGVSTAEGVIDNFDALAAVHDETKNPTMWELSGMRSYPTLPSAQAVELLDEIRATIPLVDYSQLPENPEPEFEYPEGVQLMWSTPFFEAPTTVEIVITHSEYRESDWDAALGAAVRAAELANLNFRYAAGDQQFQLHTSTCEGTVAVSGDDRKLFDTVLASGAQFLTGAAPGVCIPEQ
ncbi:hypothetical protein [Salinibacterium sp. M195]|uniref:hypothetical protein n=1 Tax=Salinibacterium sp. M195 TaxID=2583374 RepID=UPI001C631BE6|nr:hypothetical protein [Salinibacterium sp. M195]QYH35244.1 hypothetical protein FFT87_04370 [Salinibacterium sp. M195]